jgi:splicing factor 3B subunit 5
MSAVYDRFNIHAQLEHLQSKYQGTGNADMTKWYKINLISQIQ